MVTAKGSFVIKNSDIQLRFKAWLTVCYLACAVGDHCFNQAFQSDYNSITQFLLTIFRMAAFEWFAAVDISSSDSAIKVAAVMHSTDFIC